MRCLLTKLKRETSGFFFLFKETKVTPSTRGTFLQDTHKAGVFTAIFASIFPMDDGPRESWQPVRMINSPLTLNTCGICCSIWIPTNLLRDSSENAQQAVWCHCKASLDIF
ncbi:hypothetical protein RLOC_00015141 [Lonchura striata]|uniref:Uncharacterized protein n=1 Tax=Lonchura striata TaxID=40157 RepID=A0A218UY66_9PASE|nr:hypothetical protein RLOC_00015141 [Lonchura striata domestica]